MDVKESIESGRIVNGVKGSCNLSHLKYFNPVTSTCIDYMHSILEGVTKNFFKYWFSTEYRVSERFSLRKFIFEIDRKLINIRPPSFVPCAPRSLETWKQWRAHEFLAFILYYALPALNDFMATEYYNNYVKFVIFVEILLSKEVQINDLKQAQYIVIEFIEELSMLYPKNIMLSGVHELLHFVECTLDFGPMNSTNLFTYEELNRKITRTIKGKDLIGEEFIKLFSTAQSLSKIEPSSEKLKQFLMKNPILRTSNRKNQGRSLEIVKLLSAKILCCDEKYLELYNNFTNDRVSQIYCVKRLQYKSHIFTSYNHKAKFCDSCFMSSDGSYGLIEEFLCNDDLNVYVLARRIVTVSNPFYSKKYPIIKSNLFISHVTDELILKKIDDIQKVAFIFISEVECYVSKFSTSHLFT